jgi:putative addiction module component (TIGR02574 family)
MGMPAIDIDTLTPAERLRSLDDLWASLTSTPEAVPLTPLQRDELDRRLDELDRGDVALAPWDEVKRRLRARAR